MLASPRLPRSVAVVAAGALALAAGACASWQGAFACDDGPACVLDGVAGRCEPTGYCSFPDATCPTQWRYGAWAGRGYGGACVGGEGTDGGPADGPRDGADASAGDAGDAGPGDAPGTDGPSDGPQTDVLQTDAQTDVQQDAAVCTPTWWNPAWSVRRQLTIVNTGSQSLPTGFQLGAPIDVENVIGAGSWNQLRVVRWTGSWTELTRVLEDPGPGTVNEWLWFKLAAPISASTNDTSYWIYYGNSSAGTPPSDPAQVFEFHDDFSGGSLGGAWLTKNSPTVSGGEVVLDYDDHIGTTQAWGPGYAVDVQLRITPVSQRFWLGFHVVSGDFPDIDPWILWITRSVGQIWPEFTTDGAAIWEGSPREALDTSLHLYGIDRFSNRVVYRLENAVTFDHGLASSFTTSLPVRITNETSSGTVYVDMVRVRRTAYPFPTMALGGEETCP